MKRIKSDNSRDQQDKGLFQEQVSDNRHSRWKTLIIPCVKTLIIICVNCSTGMICGVGISFLKHADLATTRNMLIVGFSIFFGLTSSTFVQNNPRSINLGTFNK